MGSVTFHSSWSCVEREGARSWLLRQEEKESFSVSAVTAALPVPVDSEQVCGLILRAGNALSEQSAPTTEQHTWPLAELPGGSASLAAPSYRGYFLSDANP